MNIDLTGQHALVTGGTKGIGEAIVDAFLAAGATVVTIGTNKNDLEMLTKRAEGGNRITALSVDLSDDKTLHAAAEQFGKQNFSILVNNAAVNIHGKVGVIDWANYDKIYQVNVRAPFVLCQAIVPGMAARGYGRVVNIGSILSKVSISGRASYASSKSAIEGFTRTLALDYAADGVLVNALSPGFIGTEMTKRALGEEGTKRMVETVPMRRLGTVEEVAAFVTFLASPLNSFMTGQNLIVDGGFTST